MGLAFDVCLHPLCSLLHCDVLGIFVPQRSFEIGAVAGYRFTTVYRTDLCAGSVSYPNSSASPATTSFTLHRDSGAGKSMSMFMFWEGSQHFTITTPSGFSKKGEILRLNNLKTNHHHMSSGSIPDENLLIHQRNGSSFFEGNTKER